MAAYEHGCVVARCRHCGFERLVGLSCKRRGFCPSCVEVPIRHWVVSLPFQLRYLPIVSAMSSLFIAMDRNASATVERISVVMTKKACHRPTASVASQYIVCDCGGSALVHGRRARLASDD